MNSPSIFSAMTLSGIILVGGLLSIESIALASNKGELGMPTQVDCGENALKQSRCIIETILNDVEKTYNLVGGGGISSIKQDSTWTYTISISQEGRLDLITYTVELTPEHKIIIKDRKTGTEDYSH